MSTRQSGDKTAPSPLWSFLARRESLILWLLAVLAAVLGGLGIHEHRQALGKPYDILDMAYYLILLFIFRTGLGLESHHVPWMLSVARLLAPAVLSYAALRGLASVFREQLAGVRLHFFRNHVVVCGLGDKGLQLVRDLCARRMAVVVIESNRENRELATVRTMGALVVMGNATDELTLHKARVGHARILFAFTGDDGINVEIALATHRLFADDRRRDSPLRCFVHLYDTNFAAVVRHHPGFAKARTGVSINVVRTNNICARMLFDEFPLDDPAKDSRQPHLIIAGFGNMGESIAIHAAHVGQFADHRPLKISVVDQKPSDSTESLFRATYPAFCEEIEGCPPIAELEFHRMDIQSTDFFEKVKAWADETKYRTTIVISIHDDTKAFACAYHCIDRTHGSDIPVHVRLDTNKGFALLLRDAGLSGDERLGRIHPFGMLDTCCTLEKIEGADIDQLARKIHDRYRETCREEAASRQAPSPPNPADVPWEELEEKFKESNRCQADHIAVKLRAIRCKAGRPDGKATNRVLKLDPVDADQLARLEHKRWCAERRLAGWKKGQVKKNLETPHLDSWEKLAPDVKAYDTRAVEHIPALLESVGLWIYREP